MPIESTEFLSDRVRVHYRCMMPWATPDQYAVAEVLYDSIITLPAPPPLNQGHDERRHEWEESISNPTQDVIISFQFAEWQETDDFAMQTLIGGPYLGTVEGAAQAQTPFDRKAA